MIKKANILYPYLNGNLNEKYVKRIFWQGHALGVCSNYSLCRETIKNKQKMILKFGKYKGQRLEDTPQSYQDWLMKQDWFKAPKQEKPLHQQLNGWDGRSRKGQAVYDAIFEQEKKQGDMLDRMSGMYEEGGMYYGV